MSEQTSFEQSNSEIIDGWYDAAPVERAVQFANPLSGEVLTLTSPSDELGRYLNDLREFESVIREHRRMVNRELVGRMDRAATWTHHLEGGLKMSAPSPQPSEKWDGPELRQALLPLVDEGLLSIEAVDAAVEVEVPAPVYKPKVAAIKKLRKLGGRVAEIVDALAVEIEKGERSVTVTPS